jgi:hypothetical protein
MFILGADNFVSAPTVGQFGIPTAGSGLVTPSVTVSTTKFCIKIEEAVVIPFGMNKSINAYKVRVVNQK